MDKPGETLSADEVRALLRQACKDAGGIKTWADKNGVSPTFANMAYNGRRGLGPSVTRALGLEQVVLWRRRA